MGLADLISSLFRGGSRETNRNDTNEQQQQGEVGNNNNKEEEEEEEVENMDTGIQKSQLYEPFTFKAPTSLDEVLKSPQLRQEFRNYLEERVASESLLFYETIELYEKIDKPTWRQRAAEGMINKFVSEDSDYWVNLSGPVQMELLNTTTFNRHSFDKAKDEVYQLMKANFFESFVRSLVDSDDRSSVGSKKPDLAYMDPKHRNSMVSSLGPGRASRADSRASSTGMGN